jgi:outer membrane protein FlgP
VFEKNRNRPPRLYRFPLAVCALSFGLLMGCDTTGGLPSLAQLLEPSAAASAPQTNDEMAIVNAVDATAAVTQPRVEVIPTLTGMGYASISAQPAKSANQRRLMAIRSARLQAMRNLTEQVHGVQIDSQTTIIDAIVQNDSLRASVDGVILGAKTVRINPVGRDTYEVVLELDQALLSNIMRTVRG